MPLSAGLISPPQQLNILICNPYFSKKVKTYMLTYRARIIIPSSIIMKVVEKEVSIIGINVSPRYVYIKASAIEDIIRATTLDSSLAWKDML
jgi:hypothetical protein